MNITRTVHAATGLGVSRLGSNGSKHGSSTHSVLNSSMHISMHDKSLYNSSHGSGEIRDRGEMAQEGCIAESESVIHF